MTDPFEVVLAAVRAAELAGARYADARVVRVERESLTAHDGEIAAAERGEELGVGVRALAGGAFGFAAAPLAALDGAGAALAASLGARAVEVARALGRARRRPVEWEARAPVEGEHETPVAEDPFALPLAAKLALLRDADRGMLGREGIVLREASYHARRCERWYASSEGTRWRQLAVRTGGGIAATARAHGEVQRRSAPTSFGGNSLAGGFERARALGLEAAGPRTCDEALLLCSAAPCPPGRRALIAGSSQLALQIHESVGHPSELDRALGQELDLAGSSFLAPGDEGSLRFGSEAIDLVADPALEGGLDARAFDDDGLRARRFELVRAGVFVGWHAAREHAARAEACGVVRAESWWDPPIVRMTNVSLAPGSWTLARLVAATEDGVLCDTPRTWSIDERRVEFQFTTEIGWEIRDGRVVRVVREPTYQGTTLAFWRSCDAVCDDTGFATWGIQDCGKGNPLQLAEMSHGAAPARFRDVRFVR